MEPKIIILNNYSENDCTLIKLFSELFTLSGFSVRCKNELIPCKICGKALPCEFLYDLIKNKYKNIPSTWSPFYKKCKPI